MDINTFTPGIILLSFVFILYGISYISYLKDKISISLFSILLSGLILRLFCASDPMIHKWDERYHALVAKNIIEQPLEPKLYLNTPLPFDYKNWTSNAIWLHKQPSTLWTMAASMALFGVDEVSVRLPSVILSLFSILLTFFIALLLFQSNTIGLIAAFLQSINGLIIELSAGRVATDHIDTYFLFFIELSILFLLIHFKKSNLIYLIIAGVACGLAILTKWLPALIIFPLYLIIHFKSKSFKQQIFELCILSITILLIFLPWQVYALMHFPLEYLWEQKYNMLHFTQGLEGHDKDWWYFIDRIRIVINESIYLVLLWFIIHSFNKIYFDKKYIFLIVYISIPLIVFSLAKTKMQGYLLFTFPAYFIIIGIFIEHIIASSHQKMNFLNSKLLKNIIVFTILSLSFRYGIERVKPFETHHLERLAKSELMGTQFPNKSILFNISCPIEVMFYTNSIAYTQIPDSNMIEQLITDNYNLFIVEDNKVNDDIMNDNRIKKIRLKATIDLCR